MNTRLVGPTAVRLIRLTVCAAGTFAIAPRATLAQTEEPDAPNELKTAPPRFVALPPPLVPDATLQAMTGRLVALHLRDGTVVGGRLVGFDADTVTLAVTLHDDVTRLDKRGIITLRAVDGPEGIEPAGDTPLAEDTERAPQGPPPEVERHFALTGGLAGIMPSAGIDLDYRLFYAFASVAMPLFPLEIGVPLATGAGVSFPVERGSRWKIDLFADYLPWLSSDRGDVTAHHSFGAGVGIHFTSERGFTFGCKLPLIGYGEWFGGSGIRWYYYTAIMSLQTASFGYRF